MSGRTTMISKPEQIIMSKTTLAKLQKDEFEVHTRNLRNGCKFYQNAHLIQQLRNSKILQSTDYHIGHSQDVSVASRSQRSKTRGSRSTSEKKETENLPIKIKSIMKSSKQIFKNRNNCTIQNCENQTQIQNQRDNIYQQRPRKIQKPPKITQFTRKARNMSKKCQVAEISDSFETPQSRKKQNIDQITNTTKISSEMALKKKFDSNFENHITELYARINHSQRKTDGITSLTSASRGHPQKMSYNDYIKQEMEKQASSKSVGGGMTAQRGDQDNKFGFLDTQLDDDTGHGIQSAVLTTKRSNKHKDFTHNLNNFERLLSPSSLERQKRAQELIENINKINLEQIKTSKIAKKPFKKLKANKLVLAQQIPSTHEHVQLKNKIFKVYEEDALEWPVNSYLIQNIKEVPPKHGASKRISFEQDYNSDKDIVNSAKQKNKRDLKQAINQYLRPNKGSLSD